MDFLTVFSAVLAALSLFAFVVANAAKKAIKDIPLDIETPKEPVLVWECPHCHQLHKAQKEYYSWDTCMKCGMYRKTLLPLINFKRVPYEEYKKQERFTPNDYWVTQSSKWEREHRKELGQTIGIRFDENGNLTQNGEPL